MDSSGQSPSVRPKQGAKAIGVGLSTFWRFSATRPDFPRARRLSPRCTVFDLGELIAWRDAQGLTKPAAEPVKPQPRKAKRPAIQAVA